MLNTSPIETSDRYARCIKASKKVRWDIDTDVIRGRDFDFEQFFLPAGLSKVDDLAFLSAGERRLLSQVQGRTYAYLFGLVERFIGTGSARALQRRRIEAPGVVPAHRNDARSPHGTRLQEGCRSERGCARGARQEQLVRTGAHLPHRTVHAAAFSAEHRTTGESFAALEGRLQVSLGRGSATRDELEWVRENRRLPMRQKEQAVDDLIALVGAVDGILQAQAAADAEYFLTIAARRFTVDEAQEIHALLLRAYRWQYIVSGVQHPHFGRLLTSMTTPAQMQRIQNALQPIVHGQA